MNIIESKVNGKGLDEIVDNMANKMLVNLTIRCNEGTFDISRYLYRIPDSILRKEPVDYTKEDIKIKRQLEKVKKVTKTITKSLIPEDILKIIKEEQYEVRKFYNSVILMNGLPIMSYEDYIMLKQKIDDAEKSISSLQQRIELNWDDNIETFRKDLLSAYPDSPIENIDKIVKIAKSKKARCLENHGFSLNVVVLPSSNGIINDDLKKVVADQTVTNMHNILEVAIKDAFEDCSNVFALAQENIAKGNINYKIHGKTKNKLEEFGPKFKRRVSAIGINKYKDIIEVQKGLDDIITPEIYFDEDLIIDKCGELSYKLMTLAKDNDVELNIDPILKQTLNEFYA